MKSASPPSDEPGRRNRWPYLILALVVVFLAGYIIRGMRTPTEDPEAPPAEEQVADTEWTCSMHPDVRRDEPGQCPICNMDLIPVGNDDDDPDIGPRQFSTSEAARELMNIQTAPAERRFVEAEVRMVGKVDYDETRLGYITAWVPGRIDRLYADFTGIHVRQGDHMVDLFSPELLTAQDELRRAVRALENIPTGAPEVLRQSAQATANAARARLRRWGLTDAQITAAAESTADPSDYITIYAPIGGTVIERDGQEGMYVDTGTQIYTIADLSVVWVKLDAYESDLPWIHYGQPVEFTSEAHPGERFEGQIAFINPTLDERTRTVQIRVNVPNPDDRLKPGMFVRGVVRSRLATEGRVMDPELAGKWISPMHPEIVSDGPGACDVCGMPLVPAEELGYVSAEATEDDAPLVIPASAPLITGRRAIVYVTVPGRDRPTFEGREVVLGPRAGDFYLVESGLEEGERVVTHGNFKIDSAMQIRGRPSMMSPRPDDPLHADVPEDFHREVRELLNAYLEVQDALAHDSFDDAVAAAERAHHVLADMDDDQLEGDAAEEWDEHRGILHETLEAVEAGTDIDEIRTAFEPWSDGLTDFIRVFGIHPGEPVYILHCPMAFDFEGANWLQTDEEVRNPYFGSEMYSCGTVEEELIGPDEVDAEVELDAPPAPAGHEGHDHG